MATSLPRGQTAISCELCETNQKIKWICVQCKIKMCGICEKVHGKIKSSSEHTIIDIKEMGTRKMPTLMPDFTRMKCQIHLDQYCCFFCAKCDTLVCPECVMVTHKKHKLKKISEEYKTMQENSEKFEADLQQEENNLKELRAELGKIEALQKQGFSKTREDILQQKDMLVNAAEEHSRNFLDEVEKKHQKNLKRIEEKKNDIKNMMKNLQKKRSEVENLLLLDGSANIFTEKNPFSLPTAPKLESVRAELAVTSKLLPGDAKKISSVFGSLQDHVITDITSSKILRVFSTKLPSIIEIQATPEGTIWTNCHNTDKLLKTKVEGKELKILAEFNINVRPSLYNNGDLLLAPMFGSVLKIIKADQGEIIDTDYNIAPLKLTAVHVSQYKSMILIGARTVNGQNRYEGQLIVMDKDGNKDKVFYYDEEGQPLFTSIFSITCTSQGTIGVVDVISYDHNKGKVIILDMHGGIHEYYGHSSINSIEKPFGPTCIIASPWNNFIIAEGIKHYIHVLDEEGCFLTLINTKELGIEKPFSLCFTDHLIISGQDKEGAKIYELDFFPW